MMKKATLLVLVTAAIALALVGCGSSGSGAASPTTGGSSMKLAIDGTEVSCAELSSSVLENELLARDYTGKSVEATAVVNKVSSNAFVVWTGSNSQFQCQAKNGHIECKESEGCRLKVEVGEDASVASSLKEGDTIKVTGTISGFYKEGLSGQTLVIGLMQPASSVPSGEITIEKI